MRIRPPTVEERAQWQELWDAYLVFYEQELDARHANLLWDRIHNPDNPIRCLVAEIETELVGLVQFFPHIDTWETNDVCYLQDLYVKPDNRGQHIGRSLIEAVAAEAESSGWEFVYWLTADDNDQARILYDNMTGGPAGFTLYQLGG